MVYVIFLWNQNYISYSGNIEILLITAYIYTNSRSIGLHEIVHINNIP